MLKLNIKLDNETSKAFDEVKNILSIEADCGGINANVFKCSEGFEIIKEANEINIYYCNINDFTRALSFIKQHRNENVYNIKQKGRLKTLGAMLDNSRNAVMKVETVKEICRYLAVMGFNALQLYTEDTFKLEDYPYFGYMRGRYTKEELEEIDSFAASLSIELIPCVQTLAHLNAIFRWDTFQNIRDCGDILLAGEEKTYKLIDDMLKHMSDCIKSKRINIGMDEAAMLGRGKYIEKNGYKNPNEIMLSHLDRITELCKKYGYKPMMWSDMFFTLAGGGYYDKNTFISDDVISKVPEDLTLVYWDYYNSDNEVITHVLEQHMKFKNPVLFAGGAWRWMGLAPLNCFSLKTSRAMLGAENFKKIDEVMVTAWGDDGSECSMFTILPVLQLYAEYSYSGNTDDDTLSARIKACTDIELSDFLQLDLPNFVMEKNPGERAVNPSKYLLYSDVLCGLFDAHTEIDTYRNFYKKSTGVLRTIEEKGGKWTRLFRVMADLCAVLEDKADVGLMAKTAYDDKDNETLKKIKDNILPELLKRIDILKEDMYRQWFFENKPFGYEIIDIRFGGLENRVKTAIRRITEFLNGETEKLDELEETRLDFACSDISQGEQKNMYVNNWGGIVSASSVTFGI